MLHRLLFLSATVFFTTFLFAQSTNKFGIEIQAGIGSYTTFDDFRTTIFTIGDRNPGRTEGNIGESELMPYLAVNLSYDLAERWRVSPFIQYQFGQGTLFENEVTIFGATTANPEETRFSALAENEIDVLNFGVLMHYRVVKLAAFQSFLGAGLSYRYRDHYYRNLLEVDFTDTRQVTRQEEFFTNARKSALGIPVTLRIEQGISQHLTVSLNALGQVHLESEDTLWSLGLGLQYRW